MCMKNYKVLMGWLIALNLIIAINQSVYARELSEIVNKTTLNYNVNEDIKEIKQWKDRELALYSQTGDEQFKLQSHLLHSLWKTYLGRINGRISDQTRPGNLDHRGRDHQTDRRKPNLRTT